MNSLMQILDEVYEFIKNCVPTGAEQYLMAIDICADSVDDFRLCHRHYCCLPHWAVG